MTVTEVLKLAREKLAAGPFWQMYPDRVDGVPVGFRSINANCAITAMIEIGGRGGEGEELRRLARERLAKAANLPNSDIWTIIRWNDTRSAKAEVLAAFDRAITDAEAPVA